MRRFDGARALGIVGVMLAVVCGVQTQAGTPDFEVLSGSSVTLGTTGAQRSISPQPVEMAPSWQTSGAMRSVGHLEFPKITLAFSETVFVAHNQEFTIDLDPVSGIGTLDFPLWVRDPDGHLVELPTSLTTGVPSEVDCTYFPYCLGTPGDPPYCQGSPWNPATGEVTFVGTTLVPFGSGTEIDCAGVLFVIKGNIEPGDADADLVEDFADNCPDDDDAVNLHSDVDGDGIGDVCDNCPTVFNPSQRDSDANGAGNTCQALQVNFQPSGAPVPADYVKDSGTLFNDTAGYGWLDTGAMFRDRNQNPDQRLDTLAFMIPRLTWEAGLPVGTYDLEIAVGDPSYAQGPQYLAAEETVAFDQVVTAAGEHQTVNLDDFRVGDGRLSLAIGGGDGGAATAIDYVTVTETGIQPYTVRAINFAKTTSPNPDEFAIDAGAMFDPLAGFGWNAPMGSRQRNWIDDPLLDTFVYADAGPRLWELDVPGDEYTIEISVGDARYAQGPHFLEVEGEIWLSGALTAAGEFLKITRRVRVVDGQLSVVIGEAGAWTTINYLSMTSLSRDLDGDGVANLLDNCETDYNPLQEDADNDGIGDACLEELDGDGWNDSVDNCPEDFNPDQADADGDNVGDVCDCAPNDGGSYGVVDEVENLAIATGAELGWSPQQFEKGPGTVYDVCTQDLGELRSSGGFGTATCLENGHETNDLIDSRTPLAGEAFIYLVRAKNACGAGSYGVSPMVPDPRAVLDASGACP